MGFVYPVTNNDQLTFAEILESGGAVVPAISDGSTVWKLRVTDHIIYLANVGPKALLEAESSGHKYLLDIDYLQWLISAARYVAEHIHRGKSDYGGNDYFGGHVESVAERVSNSGGDTDAVIVAYLHDVLEDSDLNPGELEKIFPPHIVEAVSLLTHERSDEQYYEYLERLSSNPLARIVKTAEVEDNRDVTRLREITDKDAWRLAKYDYAARFLAGKAF